MQIIEILNALPKLTIDERLQIVVSALKLNQQERSHLTPQQQRQYLALAALTAVDDYAPGSDLLAFEALDGEDVQVSQPRISSLGALAHLGSAPSEAEIDEVRREMCANFGEDFGEEL
jgi:hypothetical protein